MSKQRLTDKDVLKKKFSYKDADSEEEKAWITTFRRTIEQAPEVDSERHEYWENTSGYDEWFCSGCGYTVNCDEYPTEVEGYQYCGKCGAKMKEEQK